MVLNGVMNRVISFPPYYLNRFPYTYIITNAQHTTYMLTLFLNLTTRINSLVVPS